MSYAITRAVDGEYIITTIDDDVTRETAQQHALDAHALGAELGIRCFLFDVTAARNSESVLGNFKMTHEDSLNLSAQARRSCVAVLVARGDRTHDFNETLARNAGLDVTSSGTETRLWPICSKRQKDSAKSRSGESAPQNQ
jgi:hypothetical protein